ncbi:MAG: cation:proton antiporter, partial [Planctomycetota bacterium]
MRDLVLVMAVSLAAVYLLRRLKIPAVVGFLVAGVLIGPGGLALVSDRLRIEAMAEAGVIFLLFTIGLRFSLGELARMKGVVFGAGALQVLLTAGAAAGIASAAGVGVSRGIFLGFLLAMSSTAIVMKLLEDKGETATPHGRFSLGVLIFQDLAVVPLMLLTPMLAPGGSVSWIDGALALFKSLGLVGLILVGARVVFPRFLERIVRTRSREVFTLATLLAALGTAYLAGLMGISTALGAFLAGIVISESDYSAQILSDVLPLRDVFSSLFFVSIGMLVDPRAWAGDAVHVLLLAALVVLLKALATGAVALLFGFGARVAVVAGIALAQVGEFSFILAEAGAELGLLDPATRQHFLSVCVLSMAVTPFGMLLSPALASRLPRLRWMERYLGGGREAAEAHAAEG